MSLYRATLAAIFVGATFLCLTRLNEPALWDDEAHVALFARNFLATGHWSGWDGRNLSGADRNGMYLDENFRHVLPQLDYAIAAIAFYFFGVSDWSARVIFAFAGIATLGLFYWWLRIEAPNRTTLHVYAMALLGFSTTFLLNVRTCRYYSIAMLLIVLGMIANTKFARSGAGVWLVFLAVTAALLFYASALVCFGFLLALGIHHLIFERKSTTAKRWAMLAGCAGVFILLTLPYAVLCVRPYMQAAHADVAASETASVGWLVSRAILFWWNLRELDTNNALCWPVAIGLAGWYFFGRDVDTKPVLRRWAVLAAAYVIGIVLLSPQPVQLTQGADVRYLSPILPLLAAIAAAALAEIHVRSRLVAAVCLVVFLGSNATSAMTSGANLRLLLPALISEICSPYPTAFSEAENYLRKHAVKDDSVIVLPEAACKPMLFRIGDYLRFQGLILSPSSHERRIVETLNPAIMLERARPEWVVCFGAQPGAQDRMDYLSRAHDSVKKAGRYDLQATLPFYWDQCQRPELIWHSFGPLKHFNYPAEGILIFKLTEGALETGSQR